MKEESQKSRELTRSRSSSNRDSTKDHHGEKHDNTGVDDSEKLSTAFPPVSKEAESNGIEGGPKKRDPVRSQLNGMIMTPRNALLRKVKSMRMTPYSTNSSRKPLIDSKKNVFASRITKGLQRWNEKERDEEDDIYDSDEISIDVNFNNDDNEMDKQTNQDSPKSESASGDEVKDENEDTNKLNSFVKTKEKGKWDLKSRFKKSLKQEKEQTTQYGLMMSASSLLASFSNSFNASFSANFSANFTDDDTKDLADHYGGELKKNGQQNEEQIDFYSLSNKGKGDLFAESFETDDAQSIETDKAIYNNPNKSMGVVVPCNSPSLSPNSRARAA